MSQRTFGIAVACVLLAACANGTSVGTTCESDENCASGVCVDGRCDGDGDVTLIDADVRPFDSGDDAESDVPPLSDADAGADPDTDAADVPAPGSFGAPCEEDRDCDSGYCVESESGLVCTVLCADDCPAEDWECQRIGASGGDQVQICIPPNDILCDPCTRDLDCGGLADLCVNLPDGQFCASDCTETPCREGFECSTVTRGAETHQQCLPVAGICGDCLDVDGDLYGDGPGCIDVDCDDLDPGTFPGAAERCDGGDNDCDVDIDEDYDLMTDAANCGSCGNACGTVRATAWCVAGECAIEACAAGYYDVDGEYTNGCEYRCTPTEDPTERCDGVDNDCNGTIDELFDDCVVADGVGACDTGVCVVGACDSGHWDVNGEYDDGCEYACDLTNGGVEACDEVDNDCDGAVDDGFDVRTDVDNCGACGNACDFDSATADCADGACVLISCDANRWDLNRVVGDGCEYACELSATSTETCDGTDENCDGRIDEGFDLANDVLNCGECRRACRYDHATATCDEGNCKLEDCTGEFLDCDEEPSNGCEVDRLSNLDHCGACDVACAGMNASWACTAGACAVARCDDGYADCDGLAANGCEVELATDPLHCGSCVTRCSLPNATEVCVDGFCAIGACDVDYADCDLNAFSGCETRTLNNSFHCGACNNQCFYPGVASSCSGTECVIDRCPVGFDDCNETFADGCEQDIGGDPLNCGGCGRVCAATNATDFSCSAGTCIIDDCTDGFADCSNGYADGCERDIWFQVSTCGSCSTPCVTPGAAPICNRGVCSWSTCLTGFVDLDLIASNGCEYACLATAGTDSPDMSFSDTDCDGTDGDVDRSIFVALDGSAGGAGTMSDPVNSISAGILLAISRGRPNVLVAQGNYAESVTLVNGISLYGGYVRGSGRWSRRSLADGVTQFGVTTTGLYATNITSATTVQNFKIVSADALNAGESSYAARINNSTSALRIESCELRSGNGAAGTQGDPGVTGGSGADGGNGGGGCDGCSGGGAAGAGGASACSRGGAGGGGAYGNNRGGGGATGSGPAGGAGGAGGAGNGDNCVTTFGNCGSGGTGVNGSPGANGSNGSNGSGGGSGGVISGGLWTGSAGNAGNAGVNGSGGGGGGGGGGTDCCDDDRGGGGGGGGGGGCGGSGGGAGTGGGGSFGIFLTGSNITILNTAIVSGRGGNGGAGRSGGSGGEGSSGGSGGARADDAGAGGRGGNGGSGGAGGCGGGGGGGASFAVYRAGGSNPTITGGSRSAGAGGSGGAGGCGNAGTLGATGPLF